MRAWLPLLAPAVMAMAAPAWAAPRVEVVAEPPSLLVGQTGTLHVMFVSDGANQTPVAHGATPKVELGEGLDLRYRGTTSRFSAAGTRIVSVVSFQYALDAVQEGTWTVGPVSLRLEDGTILSSDSISVEVKARDVAGVAGGEDGLRVDAGFEVPEAWEGQLVLYHYELVSTIPGVRAGWRLPEFEGLRPPQRGAPAEQTFQVQDGDATITTVKGTVPLIATGVGTLSVKPALVTLEIPSGLGGFRGWGALRQQRRATEPAELVVKKLPPAPPNFSGLVGEVRLRASLDSHQAAVGESVGLVIAIDSDGSLDGVTLPQYQAEGISVYDDEERIDGAVTELGYRGTARIRRVLVPVDEGTHELPPVTLVTFSPSQGRYVTHEVAVGELTATPGREGTGEITSFAPEPDGSEAVEPVALRGPWTWGWASTPRLGLTVPLWLLVAGAPGGMVLLGHAMAVTRRRYRSWVRRDKGPPNPFSHLRGLPDDVDGRLRAYDTALAQALANRQGVPIGRLDREQVLATLPEPVAKDVRSLQRGLDSVRYGDVPVPPELDQVVRRVVAAVEEAA